MWLLWAYLDNLLVSHLNLFVNNFTPLFMLPNIWDWSSFQDTILCTPPPNRKFVFRTISISIKSKHLLWEGFTSSGPSDFISHASWEGSLKLKREDPKKSTLVTLQIYYNDTICLLVDLRDFWHLCEEIWFYFYSFANGRIAVWMVPECATKISSRQ